MQPEIPHQFCELDSSCPSSARVMGLQNFGKIFNPQKVPFRVSPQIRLRQTICLLCPAEFNSFYLTSISPSVLEILMGVQMGQNWHVPKFKNSLWKTPNLKVHYYQTQLVPRSWVSNALIIVPLLHQFWPLGGEIPFFQNLENGKRFFQNSERTY